MKKMMKKLIAMAAALVMIVTLLPAVGVKAQTDNPEETLSTTIDFSKTGTLNIYKYDGDDKTTPVQGAGFTLYPIYLFNEDGSGAVVRANVNRTTYNDLEDFINKTTEEQKEIAATLAGVVSQATIDEEKTTNAAGYVNFDELQLGIYLVKETTAPGQYVASAPFLVSIPAADNADDSNDNTAETPATGWNYTVTARPKNEKVTIDKDITEVNDEEMLGGSKAEAGVGDTVEYTITSVAPTYTDEYFTEGGATKDPVYTISDTLSTGLTLISKNNEEDVTNTGIKVYIGQSATELTENKDYTITLAANEGDPSFKVTFTKTFLQNNTYKGQKVTVVYRAEVNENAVVGAGNNNNVILDYTNKPNSDTKAEPGTVPKVYTYGLKLTKKAAGENGELLDGAEFKLYKVEGQNEIPITNLKGMVDGKLTTKNGLITFSGLATGTYRLEEVKAPDDYTLLADKIEFTITDTEIDGIPEISTEGFAVEMVDGKGTGYVTTTVVNNKGFSLPETGGMGTYLFTIGGIVIMAGAAFALIAMKKRA